MEETEKVLPSEAIGEGEKTSLEKEVEFWSKVAGTAGLEVLNIASGIELASKYPWKTPLQLAVVELECGMIKPIFLTPEGERASSVDLFDFKGAFGEVKIGDYLIIGEPGGIKAQNIARPLYADYEMGLGLGGLSPEIRIKKGNLSVEWRRRLGEERWGWGFEHFSEGKSFGWKVDENGVMENSSLVPTHLETYQPEEPETEIGTGVSYIIEGRNVSPPLVTVFKIQKVTESVKGAVGREEVAYSRFKSSPLPDEAKNRVLAKERGSIIAQHKNAFPEVFPGYKLDQPLDVPQIVSSLLLTP